MKLGVKKHETQTGTGRPLGLLALPVALFLLIVLALTACNSRAFPSPGSSIAPGSTVVPGSTAAPVASGKSPAQTVVMRPVTPLAFPETYTPEPTITQEPTETPVPVGGTATSNTPVAPQDRPLLLPADTRAGIGRWLQVDGLSGDAIEQMAASLHIAMGADALKLQAVNPKLVSLTALDASRATPGDSQTQKDHPDWFLKDTGGQAVAAPDDPNAGLVNIGNPQVQQYLVKAAASQMGTDYDGVILRNLGAGLSGGARVGVNPATGQAFTDTEQAAATKAVVDAVKRAQPNRLVIVELSAANGKSFSDNATSARALLASADGVILRDFTGGGSTYKSEADWKKDVDAFQTLSATQKIILLSVDAGTGLSADALKQRLTYSLGSYLIGKNGQRTYLAVQANNDVTVMADQTLDPRIGNPVGPYSNRSGVYFREFSEGTVAVNPGDTARDLPLGRVYVADNGDIVDSLNLPPHSAVVVVNP